MKNTEKKTIKDDASKVASVKANKTVKTARQSKRIEQTVKETTKKSVKLTTEEKINQYVKNNSLSNDASIALMDWINRGFSLTEAKYNIKHVHIDYLDKDGKVKRYNLKFKLSAEHDAIDIDNLIPINGIGFFVTPLINGKCHNKAYQTNLHDTGASLHKGDFVEVTEDIALDKFDKALRQAPYAEVKKLVLFIYANGSRDVVIIPKENRTNSEKGVCNAMDKALAKTEQVNKALSKKSA